MRIRLTLDVYREPKPVADGPEAPAIYDVSGATIERAPQFDHDTRPPIGFTKWT